ncbi:MAG: HlyD family efflux transporter periplasmic adaptor subunit [Candidatus Marinimicrobia bacterium]|nr:HlyD family efflux transporter periplasmic adaptor subunit [Candidatus Neomarinimicrobiota bacterium]
MKRKLIVVSPVIVLILAFLIMKVLASFKDDQPKRTAMVKPRLVETRIVELGDVQARLTTFGTLASSQPVSLISEVSGTLKPGTIKFQPAQSFRKGDLLLKVDDRQIKLQLNSTKSDLLTALATLMPEIKVSTPEIFQTWQTYFDSINFDNSIGPLPGADDQRLKALLARYNIYKLYFAVQDLEIRAAKHYFYAPFNGSIVSAQLRVGSTAAPGTRLAEIINLDELEVEIQVPAADIAWIKANSKVNLTTPDGSIKWLGHIDRIGNVIDTRSQSIFAYIKLDDTANVTPTAGIFLRADIVAKNIPNAMKVSRKAVYEESYVFLVKDSKFVYQEIGIAFEEGDFYILNDGLAPGDTLVSELLQGVSAGMPAKPIPSLDVEI